ncbi:hypothetical protein MMC34_003690 [Xylographa carneopallida]|nr:hypothetical protein [Xylographa carneopallida]
MQAQAAPMDYFHAAASRYWDAYVPSSRTPIRNVTGSFSVTATTTATTNRESIFEDEHGNEYYVSSPPFPSPSHQAPDTPRRAAGHVSWYPAAEPRRPRIGPYGHCDEHFIDAERRDLRLTRQRYREIRGARETSAEKLCRKVSGVVDRVVRQPWEKIMGKSRRKSQAEVEGRRDAFPALVS